MVWPEIDKLKAVLASSVLQCQKKQGGGFECDTSKVYRLLENHSPLTLQETDPNAGLRVLPLDGVSPEGLCIKLDNFGIRCFKPNSGNKSCDYLVLTEDSHKKYALFIELKTSLSEMPDGHGYLSLTNLEDRDKALQLNSGTARFEYICSVLEMLHGKKMFQHYERHHFVLYQSVRNTAPTKNGIALTSPVQFKYSIIRTIDVSHKSRLTIGDLLSA